MRTFSVLGLMMAGLSLPAQDPYLNRAGVEARLKVLVQGHREKSALIRLGSSAEGKPLWVLRVGPEQSRQALLVAANLEGHAHKATAAALHLAERLLSGQGSQGGPTWFIAPMLNPDAHDARWEKPRSTRAAGRPLDHDLDGLVGEDGPDDLDGDGLITQMRFLDPAGAWRVDSKDPRVMLPADPAKGLVGTHRVVAEGRDDDGDGDCNEDPATGLRPERGFPRGFPVGDREAGPWPGLAPETRSIMEFLVAHREIAFAAVLGEANTLLAPPKAGGAELTDSSKVKPPARLARMLGIEASEELTVAELWALAEPQVKAFGMDKGDLLQQLRPGEATAPPAEDHALWTRMAEPYRKGLEGAGQDPKRGATMAAEGSLWAWLYYHRGLPAVALDVWGPPKTAKGSDLWNYADAHAKEALHPWKALTLPDGRKVEVGGLDPFLALAPPPEVLKPALELTTQTLIGWAGLLPRVEIASVENQPLGGGLTRLTAVVRNAGAWPTHTRMGVRTRNWLPVRLELQPGKGCRIEGLAGAAVQERLEPGGTFRGTWVVRGKGAVTLNLATDHAGGESRTLELEGGR